ncbi:MAG: hypothetical protein K2P81_10045 [Bacteriovoracaceae bacterium]|nr:hypothetical protein [Bacteriovoracaceae bacterium]
MKFLLLLLLTSCLPSKGPLVYSLEGKADPVVIDPNEKVTFERISREILVPKCLECHKWVSSEARVLRKLVPGDPENSKIFQSVESGDMPEKGPPLSTGELELMRAYINALVIQD